MISYKIENMNFEKLFLDYGIEYSTKINRNWVNVRCPYCGGSSFKFGFSPSEDYCTCFACGFHNLNETLSKLLNISVSVIPDIIRNYKTRTIIVDSLNKKKTVINKIELPTDTFTIAERKYLRSRNFSPKYLNQKYGIVGGGITGKWKHRIIIPLIYNNKIVSFTGRSILPKNQLEELEIPRYKNLSINESIFNSKNILYNMNNIEGRTVVLCEGPFDVLRFDGNAVCSFGTTITQEQIEVMAYNYDKIFIIFDNEIEAQKKARKYGMELACLGVDVEIINACEDFGKNDLGECTEEEIKKIKYFIKNT